MQRKEQYLLVCASLFFYAPILREDKKTSLEGVSLFIFSGYNLPLGYKGAFEVGGVQRPLPRKDKKTYLKVFLSVLQ